MANTAARNFFMNVSSFGKLGNNENKRSESLAFLLRIIHSNPLRVKGFSCFFFVFCCMNMHAMENMERFFAMTVDS